MAKKKTATDAKKKKARKQASKPVARKPAPPGEFKITKRNAMAGLKLTGPSSVNLVATDPPWGIEWPGYGDFADDLVGAEYVKWCQRWMSLVYSVLKPNGTFFLAIGPEYVSELDMVAKSLGFHKQAQITQYSTFGVHCQRNYARTSSYWLWYTKHKTKYTFNAGPPGPDPETLVPSARLIKYNDKRAAKGGKAPENVWVLHPDHMKQFYSGREDVWLASRIAGTFKEREFRGKTGEKQTCPQMPLAVMDRIVLTHSNAGDKVLDPFTGTGTTAVSAVSNGRHFQGFELDASRAKSSRARVRKALK